MVWIYIALLYFCTLLFLSLFGWQPVIYSLFATISGGPCCTNVKMQVHWYFRVGLLCAL